jgi:methyl-accepting chemotaxis protein
MKKRMNQSTLTLVMGVATLLALLLSLVAAIMNIQVTEDRYDLYFNAKMFMDGSANLTNQVRSFAATGNQLYSDNYSSSTFHELCS